MCTNEEEDETRKPLPPIARRKLRTMSVLSTDRQRASRVQAAQRCDNTWTPDMPIEEATTIVTPRKPPHLPPKSWNFTTGSSNSPSKPHLTMIVWLPHVPLFYINVATVFTPLNWDSTSDDVSTKATWLQSTASFHCYSKDRATNTISPLLHTQVSEAQRAHVQNTPLL